MVHFKKNLTISMALFVITAVIGGYTGHINFNKKDIKTFASQENVSDKKVTANLDQSSSSLQASTAVVIRPNELLSISLVGESKNTVLDTNGVFSRPLLSPDKNYVAYLKDNSLYIVNTELEKTKIEEDISPLSFTWQDKDTLLYSKTSGGLYSYSITDKTTTAYLENQSNYQNITLDSQGNIYAEQYGYYKKDNSSYRKDDGVLFFTPNTKEQKIVIKPIASQIDTNGDLGMYPVILGISKDDKYLYIWKHPHSGSMAADGADLAVYDISNDKLLEYTNPAITILGYKDTLAQNPKDSRYLALINGGDRMMCYNKQLGVLDITTGNFEALTSKDETAMTPSYSADGTTLLYGSVPAEKNNNCNLMQWTSNGNHHIYSINTTTKERKQLTNNSAYFDFAPKYINDKDIVFFRHDKNGTVSLWKLQAGKESMLADGLIFYDEAKYAIQAYYGHYYNALFTDIK